MLIRELNDLYLNIKKDEICEKCLKIIDGKFVSIPLFIFVKLFGTFKIDDIPLSFKIDKSVYNFLFCTTFNEEYEHFTSIFRLNDSFYHFDDLKKVFEKKIPYNYDLKTCFYYLAD